MQKWLYAISERIEALCGVLDDADEESIEADVKTALMGIYDNEVPVAVYDGIGYIKQQEQMIDAIKAEIKRLQDMKKSRESRLDRVRRGYAEFLTAVGLTRMETARGTMSVPKPTLSTIVDDISLVPDEYKRTKIDVEADKSAIKAAINAGEDVPGAHLEPKTSIRIK